MKRNWLYIACAALLFAGNGAFAGTTALVRGSSSGEANQTIGYTAGATSGASSSAFCIQATTSGAMTVSYGWYYGNATSGTTFEMAVFNDNGGAVGTQVGGCSDSGTIATSNAYNAVTWSSNKPSLSASTTYWICAYPSASVNYMYDTGGTAFYKTSPFTCGDTATNSYTRKVPISVGNYNAH